MIRQPVVAGRFYPSDPRELEQAVRRCLVSGSGGVVTAHADRTTAIACLVPHAGYVFSGGVAGSVYAQLALPRRIVILGPRHRPPGANLAIQSEGAWQTSLGDVEIDSEMAQAITSACPLLVEDEIAHRNEHSIEVQLPFLQVLVPNCRFVPVAIGTIDFVKLTESAARLPK